MIRRVVISRLAEKQLRVAPRQVVAKLRLWINAVETIGLEETRRVPGFHDESLRGTRQGQRSIRLNRQYRAIYVVTPDGGAQLARVEEVTPHDY